MMGALSPDHAKLTLSQNDVQRFSGMDKWRKHVRNFFPMAFRTA